MCIKQEAAVTAAGNFECGAAVFVVFMRFLWGMGSSYGNGDLSDVGV